MDQYFGMMLNTQWAVFRCVIVSSEHATIPHVRTPLQEVVPTMSIGFQGGAITEMARTEKWLAI